VNCETDLFRYLYTISKNYVISSVRKHYYALGLALGLGLAGAQPGLC